MLEVCLLAWKTAIITPLFKKGRPTDPSNYRPVSLTSAFGKIMERVIASSVVQYLNHNNLLNNNQHGFLSKKSTLTNLLESVNDWSITLEGGNKTAVAYVDFQRAFDSVSHSKLAHKLKAYGIDGALLKWITEFLSDRKHCTRVGLSYSEFASIRSGVVQGSCLGPLLFLLFINDILDVFTIPVQCKLYADDAKLYTSIKSDADSVNLQANLDKLFDWSSKWQLNISHHKCCIIEICKSCRNIKLVDNVYNYKLGSRPLNIVNSVSDLGIIVDSDLNFSGHIASVTRKAHQRANLILRCFISRDIGSLISAFKTYVRPIVEYNSSIWSPSLKKDILTIESVQRRFTKRLAGMSNLSYHARLKLLKLESLELRRLRADLLLVYKILFGHVNLSVDAFFKVNTNEKLNSLRRHSYQLVVPTRRPNCIAGRGLFVYRIAKLWNDLPRGTNFSSFTCFINSISDDFLTLKCSIHFI